MVLVPPSLPFASNLWSYNQQAKTKKQEGNFFLFTFYLVIFEVFLFLTLISQFFVQKIYFILF
jgi:ABC-type arginine transport system permease subunit